MPTQTFNQGIIYAIEILVSIAFVFTSIALLIVGNLCTKNASPPQDPTQCQNIYISGIIMMFICGCLLVFGLLMYMVERCEQLPVASISDTETPVVVSVLPKTPKKPKKSKNLKLTKNPLSSSRQSA